MNVVRCTNLPKMDLFGKVDGFVRCVAGVLRVDTKVVKKDYNPVFEHALPPVELPTYSNGFQFEVFDWDAVGSNDFIGRAGLNVLEILTLCGPHLMAGNTTAVEHVLQLRNVAKGAPNLHLRFTITWPLVMQPLPLQVKQDFLHAIENNKILHVLQQWKVRRTFSFNYMLNFFLS